MIHFSIARTELDISSRAFLLIDVYQNATSLPGSLVEESETSYGDPSFSLEAAPSKL